MAFSMVFKVVDEATAAIRRIAGALAEPVTAAATVGEAGEKAAARFGRGMDHAAARVRELGRSLHHESEKVIEFARASGEAAEKFANSFGGMGAMVAEGFSLKKVAGDEEFWQRQKINYDMTGAAVESLKEKVDDAAEKYGIDQTKLTQVYEAFRQGGGSAGVFAGTVGYAAAAMQTMGISAKDTGDMFAVLQTKMHLTKPKQFLDAMSLIQERMRFTPGGGQAFAAMLDRMGDSMQNLGLKGPAAVNALSAVFAVAAKGAGGDPERAEMATEQWLRRLTTTDGQAKMSEAIGKSVLDKHNNLRSPVWIMKKLVAAYERAYKQPVDQRQYAIEKLNTIVGPQAALMFQNVAGDIAATGHSATFNRILGAKGNSAVFLGQAHQDAATLSGAFGKLASSMERASEALFTGPIRVFAEALNAGGDALAKVVVGLAAMATLGHAISWVAGAVKGFRLLGAALNIGALIGRVGAAFQWLRGAMVGLRMMAMVSGLNEIAAGFVPVIARSLAWAAAMMANPATWIMLAVVAAVALLGVGIYELYKHWTSIWGCLRGPVMAVVTPVVILADVLRWALGAALEGVWNHAQTVFAGIERTIVALWQKLESLAAKAGGWMHTHIGKPMADAAHWAAGETEHAVHAVMGTPAASRSDAVPSLRDHLPADRIVGPQAVSHKMAGTLTVRIHGLPKGATVSADHSSDNLTLHLDRGAVMAGA